MHPASGFRQGSQYIVCETRHRYICLEHESNESVVRALPSSTIRTLSSRLRVQRVSPSLAHSERDSTSVIVRAVAAPKIGGAHVFLSVLRVF